VSPALPWLRPAPSCQRTNGMLACPPVIERILPAWFWMYSMA
jgi:hypothetical protein